MLASTYKSVEKNQELTFPLPLMIASSKIQNSISATFSAIHSVVSDSLAINFFFAAFLSISMTQILGIIEFLQIITYMPFLIPNLPANYQVVLKLIYSVATLQLIPDKYIDYILNLIEKNLEIRVQPNYQINILLFLSCALILLVCIKLTSLLCFKFKELQKKIEMMKYHIMFGVFIQTLKEGYLITLV